MAKRDAELVAQLRRGMDAYNRGDFDAAMEGVHPEIELVLAGDQQPLKGAAQFRAWMEPDAFESQVTEPLDFRVVGNKVLVRLLSHIRATGSGFEGDFIFWNVYTHDEAGLLIRLEVYLHYQEAEALQATGLSE